MPSASTSDSFLRLPQVKQRTGLSRSSIYAKMTHGEFPSSVDLGARAVAWLQSDIDKWIANRINESRGGVR